jgi:transposase
MRKIRDVLRYRHSAGLSLDAIARSLNLSKGVVAKYIRLASTAGLSWPLPDELDDNGLEKLLYRQVAAREPTYAEPDYALVHQELKKKGVTLILLWEEYLQAVGGRGYQYTAFCTRYKDWTGQLKRSMRQTHRAGEKLFADYAGPTVPIIDATTGEVLPANIFVAVLGASSYTFACATPGQTQNDWLTGMGRALKFIGGTPALIVPDNPRALVAVADRYEPALNRATAEFANHYGTVILPARPRKPQDKAKVEVGVQVVERWILARLRHRRFFSVAELDAVIAELLPALNNRPFKKLPGCPVRAGRVEARPRQYRLPRRIRRQLLQRAACTGPARDGTAHHALHHRGVGKEQAGGQSSPQLPQRPFRNAARAHARSPSCPCGLVARKAADLGVVGRSLNG